MNSAHRLALPAAYIDPAFIACLVASISERELVEQFDRLYGASLSIGELCDGDLRSFSEFVHNCVYLRLPDEAIVSLRVSSQEGA